MTAYTIYGTHGGGYLDGNRSAGDGSPPGNYNTSVDAFVGISEPGGTAYESFLTFDTSAVVGTVTSWTFSLTGSVDFTALDSDIEVRSHDWGATLVAADWLGPVSLEARILVASLSTSGWSTSSYNVFTSTAPPASGGWAVGSVRMDNNPAVIINQAGDSRFVVCSSRHRTGIGSSSSFVAFIGDAAGAPPAPKLEISTT